MSNQPDNDQIKDIRITDPVIKKMVIDEQQKLGDSSATKTAGRIIERYFAMTGTGRTPQPLADST